ncbi:MAG: saccharopine dehydrogenase NADP-binding domain-containing protein, partial [Rhodobacteraceae bacterium]|nr:saccharopine dehydrogenase NADP-binding domain-containing protein [Paracoccaceae bacterium]
MKILILGGYGVFGGRLAELLSDIPEVEMLICGRNAAKAQAFCDSFQGVAKTTALALDRNDIAPVLADQRPDMVVDASGPFQDYGDDPYRVVKACIAAKINYLDFADAADFVFGIEQFDQPAKDAGVFVLSGVSSFPVLTAAVLREFSKDMTIKKVTGGIAPSPYAGIGLNVMRAVVGYAGGPVRLLRNGKMIEAKGLTESMRYTVSPPGRLPLANLRFSLVEVPDLRVLPAEHPDMTDIWMGAGPVPESLHRVLNLLAKMRATFRLPALTPFAKLFYRVLNLMKFGDHRGGMFVKATGHKNGQPFAMSWHLLAEGDDGPYIPSMAIESIVRKHLTGNTP